MPYLLEDLVVDRVDLVDEGANSAAFIELFKRKEKVDSMDYTDVIAKMKPEHAEVIQAELNRLDTLAKAASDDLQKSQEELTTANDSLAKANEELETLKAANKAADEQNGKDSASFDEDETIKALPEAAREMLTKMRAQKDAAEEELRKAREAEAEANAVAKAAELKNLPVEASELAGVLKSASPEMVDMLSAINAAIDASVLSEVGKSGEGAQVSKDSNAAWAAIENEADKVAKRDSITKQKAIGVVIKEQPDLYKQYLDGGAN